MAQDLETQKKYDEELQRLVKAQEEELKKKLNPLFAKMHGMDEDEMAELKRELEKAHLMQRMDLARRYGVEL